MAALIALITALAPLVPLLAPQIENLMNAIKGKGKLTPEQHKAIHELAVAVHAEVQRQVAARAAQL